MIRVSLSYIFELANALEPLARLPETDSNFGNVVFTLFRAQGELEQFYGQGSVYSPYLRVSFGLANNLDALIRAQTQNTEWKRTVSQYDLWQIRDSYAKFRIALLAELGVLHSYFVTQKGGYDTVSLLAYGEILFPSDLASKVQEAVFDAREAGKCLAYELPTACGFHVFRATESVLRRYWARVTGGKAAPKVRNIGVYLNSMRQNKVGDEKVLAALKQMADLYRNPLIHPETVLTQQEAIAVFGLAHSAIAAMLAGLPVIPPTTATAAIPTPTP